MFAKKIMRSLMVWSLLCGGHLRARMNVCELKCPDGAEPEVLKLMDKSSMTNFEGISTLKRQIRIMLQLSEVNVHPNITQL